MCTDYLKTFWGKMRFVADMKHSFTFYMFPFTIHSSLFDLETLSILHIDMTD